jgi:acetyl esterase
MRLKRFHVPAQGYANGYGGANAPAIPMRLYEKGRTDGIPPIVLYLRGRAFLDQDRGEPERPIAKAMSEIGAVVVEADYGAVSNNVFPQAMECAFQALECLSARRREFGNSRSPLFVAGDEAGGNVAAGVALKARDLLPGQLTGQMLFSPMIDPQMATASFRTADRLGMRETWSDGWSHYLGTYLQHPYAAPCMCSRLGNLAPALIMTSEDDPLRDEVSSYADRLKIHDVPVFQHLFSAGCGWTDIYKDGVGTWLPEFRTQFHRFVTSVQ